MPFGAATLGLRTSRLCAEATKRKDSAFRAGPDNLPIYFYVNAGAPFSPNFHIRLSHTATLLNYHLGLADALPDCHVGGTGAVFAA